MTDYWSSGPMVAFDTETTGIDVETARIVTAFLGDGSGGDSSWLVDPGVAIPVEATAIHGITTADAQTRGRPAQAAIEEIAAVLAKTLGAGVAVVTYNAPYDFTVLDRECRRYGLPSLDDRLGHTPAPVIDPLVLDRYVDRYRPGGRKLSDAAQVYGVRLLGAHDARSDALAALAVARELGRRYPAVAAVTPPDVHELQVGAARDQAANFQAYLRRQGNTEREVDGTWPVRPLPGGGV